MATIAPPDALDAFRNDTRVYAPLCKIVTKKGGPMVPLEPNPGQIAFEEVVLKMRIAGKPIRIIVLKARQIGFSTWVQAKLVQRTTTRPNHQAIVVAHDKGTAGKIFAIGQRMWANLPEHEMFDGDHPIKPKLRGYKRGSFMHFGPPERDAWQFGEVWPDSMYVVDTANEFESGRGATYWSVHGSEVAFWAQAETKMTALKNAVPDDPDTFVCWESTANGHNFFKEQWDLAVAGESEYEAFFWPWWKEPTYSRPFLNPEEREAFTIGEGRWGEREPELVKLFDLSKEQLYWRREKIANECSGRIDLFNQEYPSTSEDAFLGTGARVFDPHAVKAVMFDCEQRWDPPGGAGEDAPERGELKVTEFREGLNRVGEPIQIPSKVIWVPASDMEFGVQAPWKVWRPPSEKWAPHIVGCDVSGGEVESEGGEPARHAIEVIDQQTGEQVAEYTSRIDPHLMTRELYALALWFGFDIEQARGPTVAVERTGGWGYPILHTLWFDLHYPFLFRSRKHGSTHDKQQDLLGWDTKPNTKPDMLALGEELLTTDSHGIRSRALAGEMFTYVRDKKGKTGPEPGKFSDRLMAWLIAQSVRRVLPVPRLEDTGAVRTFTPSDERTGY